MQDRYMQYVENARKNGQRVERRHANGLNYRFVWENDGWISIFQVTDWGEYRPKTQARDEAHAESYIAFIEPLPPWVQPI